MLRIKTAIILFMLLVFFSIYANFMHNQFFSETAKFTKKIKKGNSCLESHNLLKSYAINNKHISLKMGNKSEFPGWFQRKEVDKIIFIHDPSTPFDDINYYVFCNNDLVVETLFIGD